MRSSIVATIVSVVVGGAVAAAAVVGVVNAQTNSSSEIDPISREGLVEYGSN